VTKLDGSAKGGILLSIYQELKIPIRWIGIGEKSEDLIPFEPETYVEALLGIES
jgi:fused signal recognition particle receptor